MLVDWLQLVLGLLTLAHHAVSVGLEWALEGQIIGISDDLETGLEQISFDNSIGDSLTLRSLFERQGTCRPPTPVSCSGGCCRGGDTCCPTSCCPLGSSGKCCPISMGGCCPTTSNCMPSYRQCCPVGAQTCGGVSCYESGAVCCNGGTSACKPGDSCCGRSCCPGGRTCCEGRACCKPGEKCCSGACCPSGSDCSNVYGYCVKTITSRTTQTTTSTTRSTARPTHTTSKETTSRVTTEKLTTVKETSSEETTKESVTTEETISDETTATTTTTTSTTATGCRTATGMAKATSSGLPVMTFVYVGGGIADDIPINICLGIRHKLGFSSNTIVLTYAGDGCSRRRGRASGCEGCCSGVRKPSGSPNAGDETECDEFPFKSTVEGGHGAWIRCVTKWQNQLQGHYLRSWNSDNNIKPGDQFIVEVTNLDCSEVQSSQLQSCASHVRQRQVEKLLSSESETTVRRTLDNRTNVVVAAFGDLSGGDFEVVAQMTDGRIDNAVLSDSDGEEISQLTNIDRLYEDVGLSVRWELDGYLGGIGLIGETESASVNFTWQLLEHLKSSEPSPEPSEGHAVIRVSFLLLIVLTGAVMASELVI